MEIVIALTVLVVGFLPSILAIQNKHKNRTAIIVLNILGGWTGIGWLVALIWAIKK